jgi:hypothetical protein
MHEINASLGESKGNKNSIVSLTVEIGGELKTVKGRDAWALEELKRIKGGVAFLGEPTASPLIALAEQLWGAV